MEYLIDFAIYVFVFVALQFVAIWITIPMYYACEFLDWDILWLDALAEKMGLGQVGSEVLWFGVVNQILIFTVYWHFNN